MAKIRLQDLWATLTPKFQDLIMYNPVVIDLCV